MFGDKIGESCGDLPIQFCFYKRFTLHFKADSVAQTGVVLFASVVVENGYGGFHCLLEYWSEFF